MGLHLIKNDLNIDFVGKRKIAYILSVLIIAAGILTMVLTGGPKYGIDFAGGATVQVRFAEPVSDEVLKTSLNGAGLPGLVIQRFGDDSLTYLLRISVSEESSRGVSETIAGALKQHLAGKAFEVQRVEMVGPKVGADLRSKALEAMFYATLITAIYISGRFEYRWMSATIMAAVLGGGMFALGALGVNKVLLVFLALACTVVLCWRLKLVFALGAVVSIVHDVLITVGVFAMLGKEFDLTIIAALLTIVGYSLNDTIIVYDRIRENLRSNEDKPLSTIINLSINQTLSRTILTSGTTLMVISALLLFGGGIIFDFSLVMFIGVLVGTASSMFVASPILLAMGDDVVSHAHIGVDERPRDTDGRVAGQV